MSNDVFCVDKIKRIVQPFAMIFVVVCFFLFVTSCSTGGDDVGETTSITDKGEGNRLKVLIVGIDGFEPSIFDKLLDI